MALLRMLTTMQPRITVLGNINLPEFNWVDESTATDTICCEFLTWLYIRGLAEHVTQDLEVSGTQRR